MTDAAVRWRADRMDGLAGPVASRDRALVRRAGAPPLRRAPRLGGARSGLGPARCWSSPTCSSASTRSTCASWSVAENLVVAGVRRRSALVVTWVVANALRGRGLLERPRRIGAAELAVFVVGPAVPSLVLGQWGDASQTVVDGRRRPRRALGDHELRRARRCSAGRGSARAASCRCSFNVVVRALPLLLLFTTFLFINAEVWQVAGTLTGIVYVAVLGIFFVLGAVFVLSRIPR